MKNILLKLLDYQYLNRDESRGLLVGIARGEVSESQVASIITIFLMRSISVDEILGFREALLEMKMFVDFSEYKAIDIVGTGGDGKNTFNISTSASFVVAGAGYPVVKHGNYGATSISGSSNAMEAQGVKFTTDMDILKKSIEECNLAYLHAPLFSPALKAVAHIRKSLGVRTFFNVLGPLINPSDPEYQLLGVYDLSMSRLYSYIYQANNRRFGIVHSLDGYDEISLTSQFKVVNNGGEQLFSPEEIGFNRVSQYDISGGSTLQESVSIFNKVINCEATKPQMDVVIVNAAFAIQVIEDHKSIAECVDIAKDSLYGKRAKKVLSKFVELNK